MQLLEGRKTARELEGKLQERVLEMIEKHGRAPKLVVVLVGDNPASLSYVKSKEKACQRTKIDSKIIKLPKTVSQDDLLKVIRDLNKDSKVDGFIVQLPLPEHIDESTILNEVAPEKDVDGLSLLNAGKLMNRQRGFVPATPKGVMMLLNHYSIPLRGKHAVVVGRSNIVGSPMAKLLLNNDATVTVTHRYTENLKHYTLQADLIVVATGVVNLITADMVKEGAIVVDVGINRVGDKIVGDVDFENVKEKTSYITPVPGGVGPMTISALIHNTMDAFLNKMENSKK